MGFTIIDFLILIAVVFAVSSGYRRGFWLSLAQYAGLVVGVIVGAALATWIAYRLVHVGQVSNLSA